MIPLTAEGKIVLVKQFRKPLEQVILEIPAGKIDPGEENQLETTAMRELEEETGYRAGQLTYINSMYLSPGFANENWLSIWQRICRKLKIHVLKMKMKSWNFTS